MLLEGLGQLEKINDIIGIQTYDLQACSITLQATTLLQTMQE
jgi:hypothetical protein